MYRAETGGKLDLTTAFSPSVPLVRRHAGDLTLLSIVGESQIGRLRYASGGRAPSNVPPQDVRELLAHAGAEDLFDDLLERYARHSGVSGVQPKVLLRADRVTHRGSTHIVKSFDPAECAELAANEFFCMQAARLAGLPAANVELSANRRILVVERFDLLDDGRYLGVEDFCVLSGLRAHGRYEGTFELLAKRLRDFVSPQHQQESFERLFATVALCCAVENGDAHLKNFAVVYEDPEGAVRLAPAYDIVSTTPLKPRDVLALGLGGSKAFPDRTQLVEFGTRTCGLRARRCDQLLAQVLGGVRRVVPRVRRLMRTQSKFARAGEKLIGAFERGMRRIDA